jgi:hypothetical protein
MPRLVRAGLLLSLVLLASSASWSQASLPVPAIPNRANWFNFPEILCRSLEPQGFVAGGWAPDAPDSPVYRCAYPPGSRSVDVAALIAMAQANQRQPQRAQLSFEVSGDHRTTADIISLAITVGDPEKKADDKKQLLACIQAVFHTIGYPVPPPLPAYLEKEEHYLAHHPYGTVSLFTTFRRYQQSKADNQILWFRLGRNR